MHELTMRLAARGHRVTVLSTRDPEAATEDPPGVTVWRPSRVDRTGALVGLLALDPDVVHDAAPGPVPADFVAALAGRPLLIDNRVEANFRAAVDSVVGPGGTIVCRSSIANPNNGCTPYNPFVFSPKNDAIIRYTTAQSW